LEVAGYICGIEDGLQDERVNKQLTPLVRVINHCVEYPTETGICLAWLYALMLKVPAVRQWLFEKKSMWVQQWLLADANTTREHTARIILNLIPGLPPAYLPYDGSLPFFHENSSVEEDEKEHGDKNSYVPHIESMHKQLMELLPECIQLCRPPDRTNENDHPNRLVQYFKLLRYFTRSNREKLQFTKYTHMMLEMWNNINNNTNDGAETQRLEIVALWHHVMSGCPANVKAVTATKMEKSWENMIRLLIKANNEPARAVYALMMPLYYNMIEMMCEDSKEFMVKWLSHQASNWAFANFYFEPVIPKATEILTRMLKSILDMPEMHPLLASKVTSSPFNKNTPPSMAQKELWEATMQSTQDKVNFCKVGMELFSQNLLKLIKDNFTSMIRLDPNVLSEWTALFIDSISWINAPDLSEEQIEVKNFVIKKYLSVLCTSMLQLMLYDKYNSEELTQVIQCVSLFTTDPSLYFKCLETVVHNHHSLKSPQMREQKIAPSETHFEFSWKLLEQTLDSYRDNPKAIQHAHMIVTNILPYVLHNPTSLSKTISYASKLFEIMPELFFTQDYFRLIQLLFEDKSSHSEAVYLFLSQIVPQFPKKLSEDMETSVSNFFISNLRSVIEGLSSVEQNEPDYDILMGELIMILKLHLIPMSNPEYKKMIEEKSGDMFECMLPILPEEGDAVAQVKSLIEEYKK